MKQVLYAEDSATSQLLMRKYINSMGELTITPSPRAAMDVMNERKFDLIITDFMFPDCDALGLIQHIRRTATTDQMPVIVVSGAMDGALLNRVLKAGANDALPKPINTGEFRAMVERMLHEPYVRALSKAISSVTCFQWFDRGMYFEFCPELNLTLSDPDKEVLTSRMLVALQEKAIDGCTLGYTTHERMVTHLIQG